MSYYCLLITGAEIEQCVDWMLALEQIDVVNKNQGHSSFLYSYLKPIRILYLSIYLFIYILHGTSFSYDL